MAPTLTNRWRRFLLESGLGRAARLPGVGHGDPRIRAHNERDRAAARRNGLGRARPVATFTVVFLAGLAVGLGLLVWQEASLRRNYPEFAGIGYSGLSAGPGAMAATEVGRQASPTRARAWRFGSRPES